MPRAAIEMPRSPRVQPTGGAAGGSVEVSRWAQTWDMDQGKPKSDRWAKLRRGLARDPELRLAGRHVHPDLLDVTARLDAYRRERSAVRSLVIALLMQRVDEKQPGLRAGGLAVIAGALTTGGVLIATFGIALLSGVLGLLTASVDPDGRVRSADAAVLQQFVTGTTATVFIVVMALAFLGWWVYSWQRGSDRARAVEVAWLALYREQELLIRPGRKAPPTAGWPARRLQLRLLRRSAAGAE